MDCLLYGHVTRDFRYQAPRYITPDQVEPEDAAIVSGQADLQIPLINVENLEFMPSTLPVTVLDVGDNTRTVHYIKPYLIKLHKVVCLEPATSFGDDLQIYLDNNPVTPAVLLDIGHDSAVDIVASVLNSALQSARNWLAGDRDELKIDKGQTYNLDVEFGVFDDFELEFREDNDPAGNLRLKASTVADRGVQVQPISIKSDGRYQLYYEVLTLHDEVSAGAGGAKQIQTSVDLDGVWSDGSAKAIRIRRTLNALSIDMSAFGRVPAFGRITGASNIAVTFPDAGTFTGTLAGRTIQWSNNSSCTRRPSRVDQFPDGGQVVLTTTTANAPTPAPIVRDHRH